MDKKGFIHIPEIKKIPAARKRLYYFMLLFVFLFFVVINDRYEKLSINELFPAKTVWEQIQKKQKLIAITRSNYSAYHLQNGRPAGLQFEMLKDFCDANNLNFELIVEDDYKKMELMLLKKKAHILCADFSTFDNLQIENCYAYRSTNLVLLQRKKAKDSLFVETLDDLNNKVLVFKKGSFSKKIIIDTLNALGLHCSLAEDSVSSMDLLVSRLAEGLTNYVVCNEIAAKQYLKKYNNLRANIIFSNDLSLCWMVKSGEDSLKNHINTWLVDYVQTKKFKALKKKYDNIGGKAYPIEKNYVNLHEGKISNYDEIFKKEAIKLGWDWRLLASLSYEESHFNPNAQNWSGAVGMMQLMPETAHRFGAKDPYDPVQNVRAGVKFLLYLDRTLAQSVPNKDERIYFVLAAYNLGLAHVIDAKNLAKKYGKNPTVWTNQVDSCLMLKSKPKYYQDEVVKSGYCNGKYTVDFVDNIFERYLHYCNIVQF